MGVSYADKQKFSFEGHRNKKKSYYPNMIRFNGSWFSNLTSEKRGKKREREKEEKKIITTSSPPPPSMGLPFQRFIEKAATNGFQDFVFAPCTFSTLNFLHGTNGW